MKVYIAIHYDYDDCEIHKVFRSQEKAKAYCAQIQKERTNKWGTYYMEVEEYELED